MASRCDTRQDPARHRVWLAEEVRAHRDRPLIRRLIEHVCRCAVPRPLLLGTDGLSSHVRALVRRTLTLRHGLYLIGSVYNCCPFHASLRLAASAVGRPCIQRTPAMAAGVTDHGWTVQELLSFHGPPPRWTPPKQRGRPSRVLKRLIERWCS